MVGIVVARLSPISSDSDPSRTLSNTASNISVVSTPVFVL